MENANLPNLKALWQREEKREKDEWKKGMMEGG